LTFELTQLAAKFDDWRAGRISAGELNDQIHQHHNGPSRELFTFYNNAEPRWSVARGVSTGVLAENEIPEDVWPYIEAMVQFSRDQEDTGTDKTGVRCRTSL
jgi:hypothetical protein